MNVEALKQFTEDWLGSDEFIASLIAVRSQFFTSQDPLFLYDAISDFMNGVKPFAEFSQEIIDNADDLKKKEMALQEVLNKLLLPVKSSLIQYGIDFNVEPSVITPTVDQASPVKPLSDQMASTPTETTLHPIKIDKTDILPQEKREPPIIPLPQSPTSPYILHQEAAFKALAEEHNINYEPIKKAFFGTSQTLPPAFKTPAAPAKIQFGTYREEPKAQRTAVGKTEFFAPKIVHYSELKTPVSPFGEETVIPPSPIAPNNPETPQLEILKPKMPDTNPLISPTEFNDRIINSQTQQLGSSPNRRKIDLKDLPL